MTMLKFSSPLAISWVLTWMDLVSPLSKACNCIHHFLMTKTRTQPYTCQCHCVAGTGARDCRDYISADCYWIPTSGPLACSARRSLRLTRRAALLPRQCNQPLIPSSPARRQRHAMHGEADSDLSRRIGDSEQEQSGNATLILPLF